MRKPSKPRPPASSSMVSVDKPKPQRRPLSKAETLRERLFDAGCDIDAELADAIKSKDAQLIFAMAAIMPFFQGKYKDRVHEPEKPKSGSAADQLNSIDPDKLIRLAR